MVRLLAMDVFHHGIHVTVAHTERAITILPTKMVERIAVHLVDPTGCARFHGTDNLRQIHLFAEEEEGMNVVGRSSYLYGRTPVVVEYLRHIGVNLRKVRLGDRVRPPLGREHQVDVYF